MQSFDLANHLKTAPELVDRVYNRPTLETLETKRIQGAVGPRSIKVCVCDEPHLMSDHPEPLICLHISDDLKVQFKLHFKFQPTNGSHFFLSLKL